MPAPGQKSKLSKNKVLKNLQMYYKNSSKLIYLFIYPKRLPFSYIEHSVKELSFFEDVIKEPINLTLNSP